ncbi:MAG: hypothetical protein GKC03_01520 [Methanomassiliicoccales archaeon]|nr:hypothetical protein [Methanomassiliicoccales archaeon]NYT14374.1 hypothetical protein [Methanomassiliicoccales archaeon]
MNTLEKTMTDLLGRGIDVTHVSEMPLNAPVLEVLRLTSRKNAVYLIKTPDRELVLKVFENDRWEREQTILLSCQSRGVLAPKPLLMGEGFIVMDYLKGPNLCDLVNETLDPVYPRMIARWLADFHGNLGDEEVTLVKSDAKLQNFILTERGVAGLDFELAHEGDPLEDLGEVCAHILNTDPMFIEEKYALCDQFLRCYLSITDHSLEGITYWVVSALKEAAHFRPDQRERLEKEIEELDRGEVWPFYHHDQKR